MVNKYHRIDPDDPRESPEPMKNIAGIDFPECREEALGWIPTVRVIALHRQVLAVARTRVEGTWACYVFPVEGKNHDDEVADWKTEGCKQRSGMACSLFPQFADIPYAE